MPYQLDERQFATSENYGGGEEDKHYLKVFNEDRQNRDLTLLVRDDEWKTHEGKDYLMYKASAVSITREDAVALAEWILERFK